MYPEIRNAMQYVEEYIQAECNVPGHCGGDQAEDLLKTKLCGCRIEIIVAVKHLDSTVIQMVDSVEIQL